MAPRGPSGGPGTRARRGAGEAQAVLDAAGAAAEVVDWLGEALQHRSDAYYVCAALHCFVRRVAGVEVGEDEDVGVSGDRTAGPLGLPYRRDGGGVVLQRAVDGQTGFAFAHDPGGLGDLVDVL